MPAAAYNVSNHEEDKLRGRDQSFRNCIVTMFVFILLCVIIIIATIPWRNTSLRRNYDDEYNGLDNPNTGKQFKKEEKSRDNGAVEYTTTLSTKLQDTTTVFVAPTTRDRKRESTTTVIIEKFTPARPTTRPDIEKTAKTVRNNFETPSTISYVTVKPSSTTTRAVFETPSRKIWYSLVTPSTEITGRNNPLWTTTWDTRPLSSTTQRVVGSSSLQSNGETSTTTRNNDKVSSTRINKNFSPLWTTSSWRVDKLSSTTESTIETSSKEFQDNTEQSSTVFSENIDPLRTTVRNFGSPSTKIPDNTKASSEEIQDNVGNTLMTIDQNTEVLSSTTPKNRIEIVNRIQNNAETSSEKIPDIIQTSPTTQRNIASLSTIISDDTEILSTTSVPESMPTVLSSPTVFSQTDASNERSSTSPSTDQSVTVSSDSDVTPTQSSLGIESPLFSSSIGIESPITDEGGFFYTEEPEGSSITSSTELSSEISPTGEESTGSTEYSTTDSENAIDSSGKTVITKKDGRFPSLETLVVSTFYRNISNISVTEIDLDWLEGFDSMTTSIDENNYTKEFEKMLSTATLSAGYHSDTSITKDFETQIETEIETATTSKLNTNADKDETITQISSDDSQSGTTINIYTDEKPIQSTPNPLDQVTDDLKKENDSATDEVCLSGHCKQFSSRIASYMNHSADPCEDFYEYACGGMEADPQINSRDLADQALDRIKSQLKKSKGRNEYSPFKDYYNSCIKYYEETTRDEKIRQARELLVRIGQLYPDNVNNPGITQLLAYMMLHHNPLLFDIVPDIDEKNPQKFILRLGPVIDNQTPFRNFEKNSCSKEDDELPSDDIDLEKLYKNYEECKNIERHMPQSVSQTLKIFDIFNHTNSTLDESKYTEEIVTQIDRQVIKVLADYPRVSVIHASYRSKNYSIMTIGALQDQITFINWTELIYTLTERNATYDTELQIYLKDDLMKVLKGLENFSELQDIHNVLFWLYARDLYEQFVKPKTFGYSEKQCLHIAMNYLPNEASRLYLSSFSETEIYFMSSMINQVFINLKETLKLKFERIKWVTQAHRNELLKKIADIQISNPKNLYLKNILNIEMTDNFFENTVVLMKRLRADMYRIIHKIPSDPEQLWTYFAKPFQSHGQAIHSLNIILIPFGAIDLSHMMHSGHNFDYLTLATIGNLIAREIAHHFDGNGFLYWKGAHDSAFPPQSDEYSTYDAYINCHSNYLFEKPIDMILPAFNKHIRIMIPPATVNERLSDVVGVRLAHETLVRMESTSSKLLPWLDLNVHKLFYLAYAQTYCTKVPLTNSYVSLYENLIMPSRLRIFAAAMNNQVLGELWKCREGSPVLPNVICEVFPDFEYQNVPVGSN